MGYLNNCIQRQPIPFHFNNAFIDRAQDNVGFYGIRPTSLRRSDLLESRQFILVTDSHRAMYMFFYPLYFILTLTGSSLTGFLNSRAITSAPLLTVHAALRNQLYPRHGRPDRWLGFLPLQHRPLRQHAQPKCADPAPQTRPRVPSDPNACSARGYMGVGSAAKHLQTEQSPTRRSWERCIR